MAQLLADALDLSIESLALDYVEQILGRLHFRDNWEMVSLEDQRRAVDTWLKRREITNLTDEVMAELERLYKVNARWPR